MNTKNLSFISIALVANLAACGKFAKQADDAVVDDAPTVDAIAPADSTGATGSVALTTGRGAALALDDYDLADASVSGGSGITITTAKVSVGSIKIKAKKERTDNEKALEKYEEAEAEVMKKEEEVAKEEEKTLQEQYKEVAKITDASEKAKKQAEFDAKKAEMKKKRVEASKSKDEELGNKEENRDKNMKWKGPYVFDVVAKSVSPALPAASVTDGSYQRLEFKLKPYRGADATDPLVNHTVYVAGSVVIGSTTRSFTFAYHITEEVKLMGSSSAKVDPNGSASLMLNFDPSQWFTGVDFSTATVSSDDSIVIDKNNNESLMKAVKKNFKKSIRFGKDKDGDGTISTAESVGDGSEFEKEKESTSASK